MFMVKTVKSPSPAIFWGGTLIIDGYQGRKINVGNNPQLEYLWIKNCPHLTTLRYAHCGLKHDAWYDPKEFNNPNLTIIDNHNWDGDIEWGNPEEDNQEAQEQFNESLNRKKNELERRKKINEQVKSLLNRIEKGEVNTFQEFINSFQGQDFATTFAELNEKNQEQFKKTFVPKLEAKVKGLISGYSKEKESEFLTEVEQLKPFFAYLTPETKQTLTRLMEAIKTKLEEVTPEQKYWPWVVGSLVIGCLTIGLMFWFINKQMKKIKYIKN
jgi:hypothetical protein